MYAWIWRHLPFGRPGRVLGSLVLALAAVALLWFVVFPAVDPHLPFNNDGHVSTPNDQPNQDPNQDNVVSSPTR
jgi:hypothetical protein